MTEQQIAELIALVEGVVVGRLIEASRPIPRETIKRISHNAGAYLAGELKGVTICHPVPKPN